jgi:hypothetical protein
LAHKSERGGEQAEDEGEAEVEGCECGIGCAEEEEREGLQDKELLGGGMEVGAEEVGEEGWKEDAEEGY